MVATSAFHEGVPSPSEACTLASALTHVSRSISRTGGAAQALPSSRRSTSSSATARAISSRSRSSSSRAERSTTAISARLRSSMKAATRAACDSKSPRSVSNFPSTS